MQPAESVAPRRSEPSKGSKIQLISPPVLPQLFQNSAKGLRGLDENIYNLLPSLERKNWSYLGPVLFIKKNRPQGSDQCCNKQRTYIEIMLL